MADCRFFIILLYFHRWFLFSWFYSIFIVVSWQMQVDTFSVVSIFAFVFLSSAPSVPTLHLVSRLWLIGSLM